MVLCCFSPNHVYVENLRFYYQRFHQFLLDQLREECSRCWVQKSVMCWVSREKPVLPWPLPSKNRGIQAQHSWLVNSGSWPQVLKFPSLETPCSRTLTPLPHTKISLAPTLLVFKGLKTWPCHLIWGPDSLGEPMSWLVC